MSSNSHPKLTGENMGTLPGPPLGSDTAEPQNLPLGTSWEKWVNKGYGARSVLQGCESARSKCEVRAKKALAGWEPKGGGSTERRGRGKIPLPCPWCDMCSWASECTSVASISPSGVMTIAQLRLATARAWHREPALRQLPFPEGPQHGRVLHKS